MPHAPMARQLSLRLLAPLPSLPGSPSSAAIRPTGKQSPAPARARNPRRHTPNNDQIPLKLLVAITHGRKRQ